MRWQGSKHVKDIRGDWVRGFSVALTRGVTVNKSVFFRPSVSDHYNAKPFTAETKNTIFTEK